MTKTERQALVDSNHLFFQQGSQRADLLDPSLTQECLIELLSEIIGSGHHLEITAVKSDHHDDSSLGEHSHFNGYCVDGWPLTGPTPGAYVDASTETFRDFLEFVARCVNLYQIGLVGDGADSAENFAAAGRTAFQDDGAAHIHLGAK